jgi:hypothetical protein
VLYLRPLKFTFDLQTIPNVLPQVEAIGDEILQGFAERSTRI